MITPVHELHYQIIVELGGGRYHGIQKGYPELGVEPLVVFTAPSGASLFLKPADVSADNVRRAIATKEQEFAAFAAVQETGLGSRDSRVIRHITDADLESLASLLLKRWSLDEALDRVKTMNFPGISGQKAIRLVKCYRKWRPGDEKSLRQVQVADLATTRAAIWIATP